MSLLVTEIFHSIQGESTHAGWPCVFVRLTGCNLRCRWCDTSYAYEGGSKMSADEVLRRINALGINALDTPAPGLIEFTGGEPLLQAEAVDLVNRLAASGRRVLVETNGSLDISVLAPEVVAIVDMKGPSSDQSGRMDLANLDRLRARDELKFVIAHRGDYAHMLALLPRIDTARNVVNASPLFGELPPAELAEWILEDGLPVRLNLQQHKHIWPPETRGV